MRTKGLDAGGGGGALHAEIHTSLARVLGWPPSPIGSEGCATATAPDLLLPHAESLLMPVEVLAGRVEANPSPEFCMAMGHGPKSYPQ